MTNIRPARPPRQTAVDMHKRKRKHKHTHTHKHKQRLAFAWANRGRQLIVMDQLAVVPSGLPRASADQATPACIVPAGHRTPLKICTSGWRRQAGQARVLDGELWTRRVRQFAAAAEFHLHVSPRDTPNSARVLENDGRFVACHAEKKASFCSVFFFVPPFLFLSPASSSRLLTVQARPVLSRPTDETGRRRAPRRPGRQASRGQPAAQRSPGLHPPGPQAL